MITACLLNFRYPELLRDTILPALETSDLIDEIIVSHGRKDAVFEYDGENCSVVHRRDYDGVNDEYGLSRRWLCWQQAKNDAVLSLGDTVLCWQFFIARLYESHQADPDIVHTLEGRSFGPDLTLNGENCVGDVPLASGRCMLLHKRLADACLEARHLLDEEAALQQPLWRNEDIFASLISIRLSGRFNRAMEGTLTPLDNLLPEALGYARNRHARLAEDSTFLRRAISRLDLGERLKNVPPPPMSWEEEVANRNAVAAAVQKTWRAARTGYYAWSARRYLDPSFMILGPERGGTSSLFYYLSQHPKIARPSVKETGHYAFQFKLAEPLYPLPEGVPFNRLRRRAYKSKFPLRWRCRDMYTGEASPQYFYTPEAPARIKVDYPDMRFIVSLRNPIDRAWSLYHVYRARNDARDKVDRERAGTFPEALEREKEYRAKGLPFILSGTRSGILRTHLGRIVVPGERYFVYRGNYTYLATGAYAFWLKHWFRFFRREQFLILQSEDLFDDPEAVMRRVSGFIGLEHAEDVDYRQQNVAAARYRPMPSDVRRSLREYFAPYNRELYELIGEEFDWS